MINRISYGVAFKIPIPNSNKLKIQGAKLDILSSEKKYEEEKYKMTKEIIALKLKMKKEWNYINMQKKQLDEFENLYDLNMLMRQPVVNIKLFYKVKVVTVKKKIEIAKSTYVAYKTYVELMDLLGELSQKNCISNSMEVLK